ncbi:MAG: 4Fe-4S binding protein [Nocardioides sp.]|uniref:4Fe-4S dicluster domain-containing protein n=1 Tax=Nocardioides sp. TaxID=35761 RepID=UPI0039E22544
MTQNATRKAVCHDGSPPPVPPMVTTRVEVPVAIDQSLCIDGCNLCVEVCPLDALAIDPETNKAYMQVDECWYCGPCADRCPTGAVTVNIPYLLR